MNIARKLETMNQCHSLDSRSILASSLDLNSSLVIIKKIRLE